MTNSAPVSVVPKEMETVPVTLDLVFRTASTVSTGGRCGCSWVVKAERRMMVFSGPRRRRSAAV